MSDLSVSPVFFTDFYNLTMAYGYWCKNLHNTKAIYHFTFRRNPFDGGFIVCAGLEAAIKYLLDMKCFSKEDVLFLGQQKDSRGNSLFDYEFVDFLANIDFKDCQIYAVREGAVVFPMEPIIRVEGPIIKCQLLETLFLNIVGFQSLIATKAARVCLAAGSDEVVELGMRHAHGVDGALSASRASFIGGCGSTSNVMAGYVHGIKLKGTQSHSWITFFEDEKCAFEEYSDVFENNTFLVDTYSTVQGVKNAVEIGKTLKAQGKSFNAIRLDSGDLSYLSIKAREILDNDGFNDTKIIASNELDEHIITSIKQEGCAIDCWGVGTKLVTGHHTAAASCVYKLAAIRKEDDKHWIPKMKLSEQKEKISLSGKQQVKRYYDIESGIYAYDMIFNEFIETDQKKMIHKNAEIEINSKFKGFDLLESILSGGKLVYTFPALHEVQSFLKQELNKLPTSLKRFVNPDYYTIGIESEFYKQHSNLIKRLRSVSKK